MEQNTARDCVISNNNKEEDNSSNNNNIPSELSMAELELLKKLEEANRYSSLTLVLTNRYSSRTLVIIIWRQTST